MSRKELFNIGPQSVEDMIQMEEAARTLGIEYVGDTDDQRGTRGTGFIRAQSKDKALQLRDKLKDYLDEKSGE